MIEFELPEINWIEEEYEIKINRIFQCEDFTDNDIKDALIDLKIELENKIQLYSFMMNTFRLNKARLLHEAEVNHVAEDGEEIVIFDFDTEFHSYNDIEHNNFNSPLFEDETYKLIVESIYKSKDLLDSCFEVKSRIEKMMHFDHVQFLESIATSKKEQTKTTRSKGKLTRLELIMLFHQFIEKGIFPRETEQADIAHMLKHIGFSFEKSEQEYSNYHSMDNKELVERKQKIKALLTELISAFD